MVEASDQGVPPHRANVTVEVKVISDQLQPLFDERNHVMQLDASAEVGASVADVTASYPEGSPPEVQHPNVFLCFKD